MKRVMKGGYKMTLPFIYIIQNRLTLQNIIRKCIINYDDDNNQLLYALFREGTKIDLFDMDQRSPKKIESHGTSLEKALHMKRINSIIERLDVRLNNNNNNDDDISIDEYRMKGRRNSL